MKPTYTQKNCNFAYQLNWGLSVFWREPQSDANWLPQLREENEQDGVRILRHRFQSPTTSIFFISTRPELSPTHITKNLKGRLQHILRPHRPHAFRRNYSLRTIGSSKRKKLENYISGQAEHHIMADPRVQSRMMDYQIQCPEIDLSQPQRSSHALYWYNLHIVFENDGFYNEIRDEKLFCFRRNWTFPPRVFVYAVQLIIARNILLFAKKSLRDDTSL